MNTNKYAVSIILPCYNVSQYIERAIDSILIQDFKDYEIIIINDGSTDNLLQKCDDLGLQRKVISKYCLLRIKDYLKLGMKV